MDYIKLSEMLFPNVDKTPEYYEKKYPNRKLPAGAEVTRLAPSPTGYLHVGNFFSALINFEVARVSDGVFYLRLEDTDFKREVDGAGQVAVLGLDSYNLLRQEGLAANGAHVGDYGPYIQSQRKEIYQTYAKYLVSIGRAFPCFCEKTEGKQDVLAKREQQLSETDDYEHKDACRSLTLPQIEDHLKSGQSFAIRLLSQGSVENKIVITDGIKGEREIRENAKDVIVLKSDGMPPYAFAHAVDDHLMRTTLVIRGEEWFSSLSAHLEIFDALNFPRVRYAHNPMICKIGENGNKRKISKRFDPEADMRFFSKDGYPKEAVIEYLLTLANTNFEEWRMEHGDEPVGKFVFSVAKINNSNPVFDICKINDISKNIIAKFTAEQVYDAATAWAKEYDSEFYQKLHANKKYATQIFAIDRYNKNPRKDIEKWSDIKNYFYYMFYDINFDAVDWDERYDANTVNEIINAYAKIFNDDFTKEVWFESVKELAKQFNFCADNKLYKQAPMAYKGNVGDICGVIRQCVTGRTTSPDLFTICSILGKNKIGKIADRFSTYYKSL